MEFKKFCEVHTQNLVPAVNVFLLNQEPLFIRAINQKHSHLNIFPLFLFGLKFKPDLTLIIIRGCSPIHILHFPRRPEVFFLFSHLAPCFASRPPRCRRNLVSLPRLFSWITRWEEFSSRSAAVWVHVRLPDTLLSSWTVSPLLTRSCSRLGSGGGGGGGGGREGRTCEAVRAAPPPSSPSPFLSCDEKKI